VAHQQTDGGRIAPSSFHFRNEAASDGSKNYSSFSANNSVGGKRQRVTLDTSALFLIRNEAAAPLLLPIAKKKRKSRRRREAELPPQPAQAERQRERGAATLLRRAARAARAEQQAEWPDTGWLDSFTQMGVAIYSANDELLVPGRIQEDPAAVADNGAAAMLMSEQTGSTSSRRQEQTGPTSSRMQEEDPAAVAERTVAMLRLEQTEPTSRHLRHTRSSRSSGPPEKQPWTFGGSFWPLRK
jgi:hypothetical protein